MYNTIQNGYLIEYVTMSGIAGMAVVNACSVASAKSILTLQGTFAHIGYKIATITAIYTDTYLNPNSINCIVGEVIAGNAGEESGGSGGKGEKGDKGEDAVLPSFKTVNNEPITGSGNISIKEITDQQIEEINTIQDKADKLETVTIIPGSSSTVIINTLAADKLTEILGEVSEVNITSLESVTYTPLYTLKFKTSENWQALTLPQGEEFILVGNTLEKGRSYEVSILKNVVNITCLDYGTNQPSILSDKTNVELLFIDENDAEFRITCVAKVEGV